MRRDAKNINGIRRGRLRRTASNLRQIQADIANGIHVGELQRIALGYYGHYAEFSSAVSPKEQDYIFG